MQHSVPQKEPLSRTEYRIRTASHRAHLPVKGTDSAPRRYLRRSSHDSPTSKTVQLPARYFYIAAPHPYLLGSQFRLDTRVSLKSQKQRLRGSVPSAQTCIKHTKKQWEQLRRAHKGARQPFARFMASRRSDDRGATRPNAHSVTGRHRISSTAPRSSSRGRLSVCQSLKAAFDSATLFNI